MPRQRGNVKIGNREVLNAILHVAHEQCEWRTLPASFGNWHTIYTRMNRWSKKGVLDRVFDQLQRKQIVRLKVEVVHRKDTPAPRKTHFKPWVSPAGDGSPKFIWLPRMARPGKLRALARPKAAMRSKASPSAASDRCPAKTSEVLTIK